VSLMGHNNPPPEPDEQLRGEILEATPQASGRGRLGGGGNGCFNVRSYEGVAICTTTYSHKLGWAGKDAAAKRIAAAWNACAGLSLEQIEAIGYGGVAEMSGSETGDKADG